MSLFIAGQQQVAVHGYAADSLLAMNSFTLLVSLETFLEAVFFWYAPFTAALSITGMAAVNASWAFSVEFSSIATSIFLIAVLTLVRFARLRSRRTRLCLFLFNADL